MKKIIMAVIYVFVLALLLAACGGTGADDGFRYQIEYEPENESSESESLEPEPEPEPKSEPESLDPAYYTPHGYIALRHIEFMSDNLYGRASFTYREKEAAQWIAEQLLAMGYDEDDIVMQVFDWSSVSGQAERWFNRTWEEIIHPSFRGNAGPREGQLSQNVILTVPGQTAQKIIVGAHYDTVAYPGASDNASGTALLLESAHRMLYQDNYHTIVYVFFGAEEPGLFGAYYYLNSLSAPEQDKIIMMINADVLFEGPQMIFGAGYMPAQYWWDGLPEDALGWVPVANWWVENLEPRGNSVTVRIDEIAAGLHTLHGIEIIRDPLFVHSASDHWIFAWEGHTVVNLLGMYRVANSGYFLDRGFVSRVAHTPQDNFHFINENWPGKIDTNMRYFSIFLEEMLLARY